ncbi:uncharacterized protein MONBRDRAFT_33620 [Monosiga brevicollis MX1]|uniref:Probable beta-glucosidase G n=1 Tax=Monosiga brevicollis TaxID=81824 RepID=A9V6L4_MONBE|nr:uncharacterized protein MONBRDRAFT_33620 [Monosiga brevicollis MX1]EDQ86829.1 predicted protein [Monosiga brevicollis MX1]|eukprot:XP_001748374.1 hypothetical protein [Monosiga brevicollis MX1]
MAAYSLHKRRLATLNRDANAAWGAALQRSSNPSAPQDAFLDSANDGLPVAKRPLAANFIEPPVSIDAIRHDQATVKASATPNSAQADAAAATPTSTQPSIPNSKAGGPRNAFDILLRRQPPPASVVTPLRGSSASRRDKARERHRAPSTPARTTELVLDLGQRALNKTECSLCRMLYFPGQAADEKLHRSRHDAFVNGVKWRVAVDDERVLWGAEGGPGGALILGLTADQLTHSSKDDNIMMLATTRTLCLALAAAVLVAASADVTPWMNLQDDPESRAHALLAQMTLAEKVTMLHGHTEGNYSGNVPAITRLNIPALNLNDGPQGFRAPEKLSGTSTGFPSILTLGATWDPDMAAAYGTAIGEEFAGKGANVYLGPGLNVARVPLCGRNFEQVSPSPFPHHVLLSLVFITPCKPKMSLPMPSTGSTTTRFVAQESCRPKLFFVDNIFLGSESVHPKSKGVQRGQTLCPSQASGWLYDLIRHPLLPFQEINRDRVSANVDERTRFEMYYPPFEGAIKAGVGSIMCSYNRINHVYSCENNETLGIDLRQRLLGSQRAWVVSDWLATHSTSLVEGLDQEMPYGLFFDSLLELDLDLDLHNVTVAAIDNAVLNILTPMFAVGLFDHPLNGTVEANVTSPAHNTVARKVAAAATVLLKNDAGLLPLNATQPMTIGVFGIQGDAETWAHGGGSGSVTPPYIITPFQGVLDALGIQRPAGHTGQEDAPVGPFCNAHQQCVTYYEGQNDTITEALAEAVDVALVAVGTASGELLDRVHLGLGRGQDELTTLVASHNRNTVVHVTCPGAVLTPWRNDVSAILVGFMGGQELGHAMADVVFGHVNPSGRLPVTFPNVDNEVGFAERQYPGIEDHLQTYYDEGLEVGYRWYDAHGVTPAFPFGHGLSYTSFNYSDLTANSTGVSVRIANTGSVAGAEIVQLYLGFPSSAGEPPLQLKGFAKAMLAPGATTTVHLPLTDRDLSIWDVQDHAWSKVPGTFQVQIGSSSRDVRLAGSITVSQ